MRPAEEGAAAPGPPLRWDWMGATHTETAGHSGMAGTPRAEPYPKLVLHSGNFDISSPVEMGFTTFL